MSLVEIATGGPLLEEKGFKSGDVVMDTSGYYSTARLVLGVASGGKLILAELQGSCRGNFIRLRAASAADCKLVDKSKEIPGSHAPPTLASVLASNVVESPVWPCAVETNRWSLRWPARVPGFAEALSAIVEDVDAPVALPEERMLPSLARRAQLLDALQRHGLPSAQIPWTVGSSRPLAFAYLGSDKWPRSRETSTALVNNVAAASELGDRFAALPMLVLHHMCNAMLEVGAVVRDFEQLAAESPAFALAAAVWDIATKPTIPNTSPAFSSTSHHRKCPTCGNAVAIDCRQNRCGTHCRGPCPRHKR